MWSLSQLQPIRVVVLYLFFSHLSRVFAIKICTAIIKEKARSNHIQYVCANALVHTWWRWLKPHPKPAPNAVNSQYLIRCNQRKREFGLIISNGTNNSVPISVTTEPSIILLNKLQDRWIISQILLQSVRKRSIMYLYKNTFYEVEHGCKL